jgi:hypothetical protein
MDVRLPQRQDQGSPGPLPAGAAGCGATPASGRGTQGVAASYVRVTGPVLRGPAGILIAVASFAVAAAVGGRAGLAISSAYTAVIGAYCMLNFLQCRETHCGITGPGWLLTSILGFATALVPGSALSWYRTRTEVAVFLVILAAGYGLEWAVAARTGRRVLR